MNAFICLIIILGLIVSVLMLIRCLFQNLIRNITKISLEEVRKNERN